MKIIIVASNGSSLVNFRFELLQRLVGLNNSVIAVAPSFSADTKKRLEGIDVQTVAISMDPTGLNPFKDWVTYRKLCDFLVREQPKLVLGYTIKPVIYASLAASKAGVKNIFSIITGLGSVFIGDTWRMKLACWVSKKLYRKSLRKNKGVFFQNSADELFFTSTGLIEKNKSLVINGSGVNTNRFSPTVFPKKPRFIFIGRMIMDKGVYDFVEAAKIIKKSHPDVCMRLVGPLCDNPSAISTEQINEWEEMGAVEYLGEKKDVRAELAKSSVLVLPSYREGLSRSILEAMAMGRPIITTDVPGCRETVEDGKNGFIVPIKRGDKIAQAMSYFLKNPERVEIMGRLSRQMVEKKYDVRQVNKVIIEQLFVEEKARECC